MMPNRKIALSRGQKVNSFATRGDDPSHQHDLLFPFLVQMTPIQHIAHHKDRMVKGGVWLH